MKETTTMHAQHFAYRLLPPRPTFGMDMSAAEAALMSEHAAYWSALVDRGTAVAFGPVFDPAGMYGLAIVAADDEARVRAIGEADPAVASGTMRFEVHPMPGAIVRALRHRTGTSAGAA